MEPMAGTGKGGKNTPQNQQEFIDYRFNELHDKVEATRSELKSDIKGISDDVHTSFSAIDAKLDKNFASKDYVDQRIQEQAQEIALLKADNVLLKKIVFGAVGLILTAFILAVIGLVIVSNKNG